MAERETAAAQPERRSMRGPQRFLARMAVFLVVVAGLAVALGRPLLAAFMGNPAVNGLILGILVAGIAYIFRQVVLLEPASDWIDSFRERLSDRDLTAPPGPAPRLLAPMARMLGRRQSGRVSLSATSLQTLLDGIASRLDETRETSRYLIGVLVFLGLLGTFYGLLETVRSVGGVIGALNVGASDLARAFADLKAGQAQNRFYNELEEWLSTYTRLSSGSFGDASEGSTPAYLHALLEQTADNLENLQRILTRGEESRITANTTLAGLTEQLGNVGEHMKAGQSLMVQLAENQMELKPSLARLATIAENSLGQDDVLRTHLRNIEAYLARLTEDVAEGRAQSVQELRGEIRLLARTIAGVAQEGGR